MKKLLLHLIILWVMSYATVTDAANLLDVYNQALVSDPVFQQILAQRLSDQEGVPMTLASLLPSANIGLVPNMAKTNYSGSATTVDLNNSMRGYVFNLNITQTVFDFAKISSYIAARETAKQADAIVNAAVQDLMLRVTRAYFTVLCDQDNARFIKASKIAYAKELEQINQEYKVGLKTMTDVYTARASFDNATAELIAAENQIVIDQENLRAITGTFYPTLSLLSEKFPLITPTPMNMDAWAAIAKTQNWNIKAACYAAQAIRQTIKQQFAGHLPTLNAHGNYILTYNRVSNGPQQANLATLLAPPGSSRVAQTIYSLNLNVPLAQGGYVVAATHRAQYNYQVANERLEQQIRSAMNTARQSYFGITAGISKIKADQQTIQSLESSLAGLMEGYHLGTQTLIDILNQQQKVLRAKQQYASDRYNYVINLLTLKQAAGTLSMNDLYAINAWLK